MADQILTTHVGSLPRSKAVTDLVFAQERGEHIDAAQFSSVIGDAVADAVKRQVECGVDLVSDGEMSKISYATYIKDRITGFDGDSPRTPPKDLEMFPRWRHPNLSPPQMRRANRAQNACPLERRHRSYGHCDGGPQTNWRLHEFSLPRCHRFVSAQ
jgi:hypothetical protein